MPLPTLRSGVGGAEQVHRAAAAPILHMTSKGLPRQGAATLPIPLRVAPREVRTTTPRSQGASGVSQASFVEDTR
jgi:hypothetical protein